MRPPAYAALFALIAAPRAARAAEPFGEAVYYLGDLHAHTGYSGDAGASDMGDCEGSCGAVADVFTIAKANGLDFVALTDHVNGSAALTASQFATLNAMVIAANDPSGGFVTIPAAEVWFTIRGTDQRLGHKTLLVFGEDSVVSGLTLVDMRPAGSTSTVGACEDIWVWMAELSATFGDAMLVPHHPAVKMPMYNDWSCHDPTWEPAVEVYSEHGNSLDDHGYDTPGEGINQQFTVSSALDPDGYGLSFGFVGGTDSHDTRPGGVCEIDTEQPTHLYAGGLTVAVLDDSTSFDRASLADAIRQRRTYVTTGPALPMAVSWAAGGRLLGGLGATLNMPLSLDLEASVSFPVDRAGHVLAVDLVGPDATWTLTDDGAGNWSGGIAAGEVPEWLYVAVEIDGATWYASVGGCEDGGDDLEWLWGSPSPIRLWEDDVDGDGASAWLGDCDDDDPTIHPGARETWYDGVDQDCQGDDDFDRDRDGVSARDWGGADCDDDAPSVFPGAPEVWYDGVDQDCAGDDDFDQDGDGQRRPEDGGPDCDDTDASVGVGQSETWYDGVDQDCAGDDDFDQDRDGFGRDEAGGDCDDDNPDIHPGAPEIPHDGIDQDCDGVWDADADGDGFDAVELGGTDCDDTDPDVYPGADETWYDGRDGNCDGASDFDADGDGFEAEVGGGADCDDTDATVFPAAPDAWYDGVDQDCDGWSDFDSDRDGFDAIAHGGTDCDDTDATISPANAERWYDGVDQDCDPATEYDADGDGALFPLDCDDTDPGVRACGSATPKPARGCATGDGGASLGLLLAGLLLARRRRA